MVTLVQRLNFTLPGGTPFPLTNLRSLSGAEVSSYGHWRFTGGAQSLVGLGRGPTLALQSAAPTYAASHLTLVDENALLTGLNTSPATDFTVCLAVRVPAAVTSTIVLAGNQASTPERGRRITRNAVVADRVAACRVGSGFNSTIQIPDDTWVFVALSQTAAGAATIYGGGGVYETGAVVPSAAVVGDVSFAIGSPYAGSGTQTADYAEAIVFNRALTVVDLDAVYGRTKAALAALPTPIALVDFA